MNIYDIAKKAGVSASTVSRVINNKPRVKAETREHIQRLLKKFNYSPNDYARGLTTRTIGILIPDIRDLNHMTCAFLIQRELAANDYCSIIINTGAAEEDSSDYSRTLRQRQVDGLITIGSHYQMPRMAKMIAKSFSHIPVVMANAILDLPNTYGVLLDEVSGVAEMVELLWKKGRRNFAFVKSLKETAANQRKYEGFVRGMAAHGVTKDLRMYACENSHEDGYATALAIMKEQADVDAILFSWDLEAAGAVRGLLDRGIKVPRQVAVTGIDNMLYCELCYPKLSTVDTKAEDMCLATARTMLDLLANSRVVRTVIIPPTIVEREST